jgi:ATP-dependent 26S proteasome regulatory subunit
MHEASRRILSVLLQKVEGFASAKKTTVVCATNRCVVSSLNKRLLQLQPTR